MPLSQLTQLSDMPKIIAFFKYLPSWVSIFVFNVKVRILPNHVCSSAVETLTSSAQREINKSCCQLADIQGQGLFVHKMSPNADFLPEINISVYIVQPRHSLPIIN